MYCAAGIWKMTISGIMPAMMPSTVALALSVLAYRIIGLPSTIWNDSALKTEKRHAFFTPGGNAGGSGDLGMSVMADRTAREGMRSFLRRFFRLHRHHRQLV